MLRRFALWSALAWCSASAAWGIGTASAQDGKADNAEDRAASFQAVSGGTQEDVAGGPLMLIAYAAVWIVVFGYVYRINSLQRGVEANVERLERSIALSTGTAAPRSGSST
jgi:CcmD family protein